MSNNLLNEINRSVGRIEGEVRGINARLDKMNGTIGANTDKIDGLETDRDKQRGVFAVIGAIAGVVATFVWKIVEKVFLN